MKKIVLLLMITVNAIAADKIGKVDSKGILFKDSIEVMAFDDPDIKGVSCYTTRYVRSLSLTDSTNSSLSCRKTGEITGKLFSKEDVFSQSKGFIFSKKTKVARFWDAKRGVLVYLSYTTSMGDKNSSHSISVVVVK